MAAPFTPIAGKVVHCQSFDKKDKDGIVSAKNWATPSEP